MGSTFSRLFSSSTDKPQYPTENIPSNAEWLESQQPEQSCYDGSILKDLESLSLNTNSKNQSQTFTRSSSMSRLTDDEKCRAFSEYSNSASSLNEQTEIKRYSLGDDIFLPSSLSEYPTSSDCTLSNSNICPNCQNRSSNVQSSDLSNTSSGYNVDELCNDLLNRMIPCKSNGEIKVLILNMMDDNNTADDLAEHLRAKFNCRAPTVENLSTLYRMCGAQSLAGAQKWAEILVIIISPSWIRAIKNVQPTHETDKETAKYHYMLLQADYLQCSCINHRIIPVVTPGTDPNTYWDINEIKEPCTLDEIKDNFKSIIQFKKWSMRGKELIQDSLKKTPRLQVPD